MAETHRQFVWPKTRMEREVRTRACRASCTELELLDLVRKLWKFNEGLLAGKRNGWSTLFSKIRHFSVCISCFYIDVYAGIGIEHSWKSIQEILSSATSEDRMEGEVGWEEYFYFIPFCMLNNFPNNGSGRRVE